ncbi:MAG: hypothetical protein Q8M15_14075 [Bacteroidota bacterium]|nr:hypothetical protein [Bacteroidota bacterium]
MKILTISLFVLLPFFANSQDEKFNNLDMKIQKLELKNSILNKQINDLKVENQLLTKTLAGIKSNVNEQITKGLELQAQNERAMNLALDEFEKKFKEQNETFSFVQDQLDKKFNTQLILLSIFMIVFIVIVYILTKSIGKRALSQHSANWNSFQEYILKKR